MARYECKACGFIYDSEQGYEPSEIAAGTSWEDVPSDWLCPLCGVGKELFEQVD